MGSISKWMRQVNLIGFSWGIIPENTLNTPTHQISFELCGLGKLKGKPWLIGLHK